MEFVDVASLPAWQRAKRDAVVAAGASLVEERALEDISIRDVATRAGVALGTVYRYFRSKDQVLAAVLEHWASWESAPPEVVGVTAADRLRARLVHVVESVEQRPQVYTLELALRRHHDPVVAAAQRRWSDGGAAWVTQDLDAIRPTLSASAAVTVWATLDHVLTAATRSEMSFEDARRVLADLVELVTPSLK